MPGPEVIRRNFRQYDRDYGLPGLIVPGSGAPIQGQDAGVAMVAGRAFFARFVPSRSMRITTIGFVTSTAAGSDDACDVGLYDSAGNRLVSAGATSGKLIAAAGYQSISVTATNIAAGSVYYAAISCGTIGTTAATLRGTSVSATIASAFGTGVPSLLQGFVASHPLAAGPLALGTISGVPFLFVRES